MLLQAKISVKVLKALSCDATQQTHKSAALATCMTLEKLVGSLGKVWR